jgi:hypothetical protein
MLEIVVQQEMREYHLEFMRYKESAGTVGMLVTHIRDFVMKRNCTHQACLP